MSSADPMTDQSARFAQRSALDGRDQLIIQCFTSGTPQLAVEAKAGIPTSASDILLRVDDEPPESRSAVYSRDYVGTQLDSVLVGRLSKASRVALQYKTIGDETRTAVFDLTGFRAAYVSVAQPPCGTVAVP